MSSFEQESNTNLGIFSHGKSQKTGVSPEILSVNIKQKNRGYVSRQWPNEALLSSNTQEVYVRTWRVYLSASSIP